MDLRYERGNPKSVLDIVEKHSESRKTSRNFLRKQFPLKTVNYFHKKLRCLTTFLNDKYFSVLPKR